MPYIAVNTTQVLSPALKERIKGELGRLIAILPGKDEDGLFVDFSGGRNIYKAGKEVEGAFIDLRVYKKSPLDAKKAFTKEVFDLLDRELDIKKNHVYLSIGEYENWGADG